MRKMLEFMMLLGVIAVAWVGSSATAVAGPFYLKNGDRVCFYGDSITDQRFYCSEIETYVLTRFPQLHVRFIDSGVGGDTVRGGWAGPINLRINRDVFAWKPDVITIMLGMNDGGYMPFIEGKFKAYKNGYKHIIASIRKHLPHAQIVLIGTTPYDDVTHKPKFPGGYNNVIERYCNFVKRLAKRNGLMYVDFNKPMLKVLKEAAKINLTLARQFFPGRIHPSSAAQMMMAKTLLKAWGAPATVTHVVISDSHDKVIDAVNSQISHLRATDNTITWTQKDADLPVPVLGLHENWEQFPGWPFFRLPQPNPSYTNPAAALIARLCGFTRQLDRQMLVVQGLGAPRYELKIDGHDIGLFTSRELAQGINLANYFTPMLWQAYHVSNIVWEEGQLHCIGRYEMQIALEGFNPPWTKIYPPGLPVTTKNDPPLEPTVNHAVKAIYKVETRIVARAHVAAQPVAHHYELIAR